MTYKITYTMTYKKFEEEIKRLGLIYHYNYCFVSVYHPTYSRYPLAYISREILNRMMITTRMSLLKPSKSNKLLTLCYKLATTPLDERGTVVLD